MAEQLMENSIVEKEPSAREAAASSIHDDTSTAPNVSKKRKKHSPWLTGWLRNGIGSVLTMAVMRLSRRYYRQLTELEYQNLLDYWHPPQQRKHRWLRSLMLIWVKIVCFWVSLYRVARLGGLARQDYYALLRLGNYALSAAPLSVGSALATSHQTSRLEKQIPVLIVPGLNTPTAFFREMVDYLQQAGFPVIVAELPERGMADIEISAKALKEQVEQICQQYQTPRVAIVGHCMGGLIAKYLVDAENPEQAGSLEASISDRIQTIISLGTGYMGAEGVKKLKNYWQELHPGEQPPRVFDQLAQWNLSLVKTTAGIAYHSLVTVWDFMVHVQKGLLKLPEGISGHVFNYVFDDPGIDHLTLVMHPKIFRHIEAILKDPSAIAATADLQDAPLVIKH